MVLGGGLVRVSPETNCHDGAVPRIPVRFQDARNQPGLEVLARLNEGCTLGRWGPGQTGLLGAAGILLASLKAGSRLAGLPN